MVDYQSMRNTSTVYLYNFFLIIIYKKKEKLSCEMALSPEDSLTSKDGTVLICVQCIAGTCVHVSHPS